MCVTYLFIIKDEHFLVTILDFVSTDRESPFVDRCESPPTFLLDSGDNASLLWDPPLFHDNSGKPVKVILNNFISYVTLKYCIDLDFFRSIYIILCCKMLILLLLYSSFMSILGIRQKLTKCR